VKLPEPIPGLVIHYDYLWKRESLFGATNARKSRPAVIVVAVKRDAGKIRVAVVPVTHARPDGKSQAIELPRLTKERLALDDQQSWVITSELNVFDWPGYDLVPISAHTDMSPVYGQLPKRLADQIIQQVKKASKSIQAVNRDI
jgi:hypothetical protein